RIVDILRGLVPIVAERELSQQHQHDDQQNGNDHSSHGALLPEQQPSESRRRPSCIRRRHAKCLVARPTCIYTGVRRPLISDTTNRTRNTTNRILAIPAAVPAIPPNPSTAAMIAITRNVSAQDNMAVSLVVLWNSPRSGPARSVVLVGPPSCWSY